MDRPTRQGNEPEYTMQIVEELTGVSGNTIRSWERRHQMLVPTRGEGGERLFSQRDIRVIAWIRDQRALNRPMPEIADAIRFVDFDGDPDALQDRDSPSNSARPKVGQTQAAVSLLQLDDKLLDGTFKRILAVGGGVEAVFQLLLPTFADIQRRFEKGEARATAFSYGRSWIRQRLLSVLTGYQDSDGSGLVVMSPIAPGNDVALLGHAIDLARNGFRVARFDQPVPVSDLARLMAEQPVRAILLCAESEQEAWQAMEFVRILQQQPRAGTDFGIGLCGRGFTGNGFLGSVKPAVMLPEIRDAWRRVPGLEPNE